MIAGNFFAHVDTENRIVAAGYPFGINNPSSFGENISAGTGALTAARVDDLHVGLFIDAGIVGRGHRTTLLDASFESIGIAVQHSPPFSVFTGSPASVVITQDFGFASGAGHGPFLTGVAFDDQDVDDFYTPGEGLGNVQVDVFDTGTSNLVGSTTTAAAGGYALELAGGIYDVRIADGLGLVAVDGIVIGTQNIKLDYT